MASSSRSNAFRKACPYCESAVAVHDLRKIPRKVSLRWYEFTPAPHTACPICGGFVVFTFVNSPLVAVAMLLVFALVFGSMVFPAFSAAVKLVPGGSFTVQSLVFAIAALVLWIAMRRASLVRET